jgi:hypothetical protein
MPPIFLKYFTHRDANLDADIGRPTPLILTVIKIENLDAKKIDKSDAVSSRLKILMANFDLRLDHAHHRCEHGHRGPRARPWHH